MAVIISTKYGHGPCVFELPRIYILVNQTFTIMTKQSFVSYALVCAWILFAASCKKSPSEGNPAAVPILTTANISDITSTSAKGGGTITSDGGSPITERGVCWDVVTPFITAFKTVDGSGTGAFTSSLSGLSAPGTYWVRAYATNANGTGYGEVRIFSTVEMARLPKVNLTLTVVTSNFATASSLVTDSGNAPILRTGICYASTPNPTIANTVISNNGSSGISFVNYLTPLTLHTHYYVRSFVTTRAGTGYSNESDFTAEYLIGEPKDGGRIFFVNPDKVHGLIAANVDQSSGVRWDSRLTGTHPTTGAYSYFDGATNTDLIIAIMGNSGNAAYIARSYTGGGFTDWYLPAPAELRALFQVREKIGNFQNNWYWTSMESSDYNLNAGAVQFYLGTYSGTTITAWSYPVRAIRRF